MGATRSRTTLFVQYRNTFSRSNKSTRNTGNSFDVSERANLLGQDINKGDVVVELSALPPKWVDIVEEIEEDFAKLKQKINQLENLHKKNVLPGFEERLPDEANMDLLTQDITSLFHAAQVKIKRIHNEHQLHGIQQASVVGKNIQISLATKLQELSGSFRKTQSSFLQKLRGREAKNRHNVFSSEDQNTEDDELDAVFTDSQLQTINDNERAITQREKEINEIVQSINGLAVIFKELQTMVIDQGTILDRIDYNIEQVNVHVEGAHGELVKAYAYQNNKVGKICIIVLSVIVFILIIVVLTKKRK
ncbi:hypothetical protein HK099_002814 [Clydaea vesicula]|uniref:t-SNARE coiled-coil homology domain-containing protein n=1 Tax=Clydaea vesicula TaxID=447962 RepID=A0AAD5U3W3_9FUNG|nr:hypothetical protein HK099_002814 [Clydaea vesicula]KAJ3388844.1 hypothetical protein HDU92_001332 [Lobulomyces angularis]